MSRSQIIKLSLFLVFIVTLFAIKQFTPIGDKMTIENLQLLFEPMGNWGIALFVAIFIVGIVLQLPGFIFIGASVVIFGSLLGTIVAYSSSVLAVIVSFYFARMIGGNALAQIKSHRVQNILNKLEENPVKTIIILRSVMWIAPPLNYALAFSKVSTRKYIIGSAIGLVLPITGMCIFFMVMS
jgi:uncharacterized membrane protein YdjX (TVP38/TMEM64 family)